MSQRLLLGIGLLCGLGSVAILTRCLLADSPSLPLTNVAATPTSNGALSVAPDSAGGPARAATPGPMPLLLSGSVAPANAIAQPGLPESLTDRAFDKYVDARLLAKAVRTLDVGLLTDVALQMAEGERILLRPHKVCSSDDLLDLARRVAVDKGDSASLARLTAAATQLGKKDLLAKLAASKTTGTPSAAAIPAPAVSVEQTSIESFTAYKSLHDSLKHAMLLGDTTQLNGISQQLSSDTALTNDQRTYLTKLADQAKASSPTRGDQTVANLRTLALSGGVFDSDSWVGHPGKWGQGPAAPNNTVPSSFDDPPSTPQAITFENTCSFSILLSLNGSNYPIPAKYSQTFDGTASYSITFWSAGSPETYVLPGKTRWQFVQVESNLANPVVRLVKEQ